MGAEPTMNLLPPRTRPVTISGGIERYSSLWMNIASIAAQESTATRRKVGCAVVTSSMGVYTGYNGVLREDNVCEDENGLTKVEVIHAESNALDKMLKEGISSKDAVVYVTLSPCVECAKRLANAGISAVYYKEKYKCSAGIDYLVSNRVLCLSWDHLLYGEKK